MATYTPNYNLGKPDNGDQIDGFRQLFNDNMDKIDNISGGGGSAHTIVDDSGTSLASESKLQFTDGLDAYDSTGKTVAKVNTTFTEAVTRTNIASGDTFATILGKIKKFFTDLKTVAFSGSYNDLSDTPTIPDISGKADKTDLASISETGSMASQNISNGTYFYLEGVLVKAISDITSGDTYTQGTNYEEVTAGSLNEKVNRSGDTMSGRLNVYSEDGTTVINAQYIHTDTTSQVSNIVVGNSTADGTSGATHGRITLFGKGSAYSYIQAPDATGTRTFDLPNTNGVLALERDISNIVENGSTASQAIPFGRKFYRNGALYRATADIASGATFSSSNCETTNIGATVGTYVSGTSITTTVPSGSGTDVMKMSLSKGVWVISGGGGYSTAINEAIYILLSDNGTSIRGSTVRLENAKRGNLNTSVVYVVSANTTIYLNMYQYSGSNKTAQLLSLTAVRIA